MKIYYKMNYNIIKAMVILTQIWTISIFIVIPILKLVNLHSLESMKSFGWN